MSKTDYDLKNIDAVVFDVDGVLSPTLIPMDCDGMPRRMANLRDGYAIQLAVKKGIKIAIITGAQDSAIIGRFNALGVKDIFMTAGAKIDVLKEWLLLNNIDRERTAYVGDDIPDIECMSYVGLSVTPSDGAAEAKEVASYITTATGGHGVARELLEQILKIRNQWPSAAKANGM